MNIHDRPATIFCDIDGTLIKGVPPNEYVLNDFKAKILDGTINKLIDWERKGYKIILTTGRKESMRKQTIKQLQDVGIMYDLLIMGLGSGPRYLINDKRPENGQETAFAINLKKDKGISNINI
tara:strand:- start:297 stop:665 length:369 start_codon:yes stop_codon:yes gene_type:complete